MSKIVELLVERKFVSRKDVERVLNAHDGSESFHRLLIRSGLISEDDFLGLTASEFGYSLLESFPKDFDPAPFVELSPLFMDEHSFLPLSISPEELRVIVNDPFDYLVIDALKKIFPDRRYILFLARKEHVKGWVHQYFHDVSVSRGETRLAEDERTLPGAIEDIEQMRDLASEAPVIRKVNQILTSAVEQRVSDIHFEPFEDRTRVRFRLDGILREFLELPIQLHQAVTTRIKIMAKLDIAERRLPQDGRIRIKLAGKNIDLRVSSLPTMFGEGIVMRILERDSISFSLQKLGFPQRELVLFESLIRYPHGIILVTGPTGSGKTTTLYAALSSINSLEKKIITVEDPVEYELDGINQIQVNPKAGLNFASGLRSIVRQDPDVILVGEIRDKDTADIAIQSALTGHLVFSTLHTNDAAGALTRLMEIGVEDYLLSSSVLGVMAQRLVRILCSNCKQSRPLDALLMQKFNLPPNGLEGKNVYQPVGCEQCNMTGYRGRIAIFELLMVNDQIRDLILLNKSSASIREEGCRNGMRLLREDGLEKVIQGVTSMEEVLRVTGASVQYVD
ncbi:MAG: type II secretion system protein GspE [Desulfovibrionales bacterium]|nr:MAG: type II secretion system protein GspE [Desulfovibrionales bacterium]